MVLTDTEVRSGWRRVAFSVNTLQDVTGFYAGDIRGTSVEHIQKHPSAFPLDTHVAKAGIDRVLRKQFLGKRMVKDRVARLEFRQELAHAVLEFAHFTGQQFGRTIIDVLRPGTVINAGDIDVIRQYALLNRFQDFGTLLRIWGHIILQFDGPRSIKWAVRSRLLHRTPPSRTEPPCCRKCRKKSRFAAVRAYAGVFCSARCA